MLLAHEQEAVARAEKLLANTEYFDAVGLGELAADSRVVSRSLIEMAKSLDSERELRIRFQNRSLE